jgi:hypothetical protein
MILPFEKFAVDLDTAGPEYGGIRPSMFVRLAAFEVLHQVLFGLSLCLVGLRGDQDVTILVEDSVLKAADRDDLGCLDLQLLGDTLLAMPTAVVAVLT